jgi:hypothetical protein
MSEHLLTHHSRILLPHHSVDHLLVRSEPLLRGRVLGLLALDFPKTLKRERT